MTKKSVDRSVPTTCPSCKSQALKNIGSIPAAGAVNGNKPQCPIPGGSLFACKACHLNFRHPKLSGEELDNLYTTPSDERWVSQFNRRRDWRIAAGFIESRPAARVLDVGCNNGEFLLGLSKRHTLFGVEFNPYAAQRAKDRGVEILGNDLRVTLPTSPYSFDVITAFDVIEHVEDPLEFVAMLKQRLAPGGEIILSSGNTESKSWTFMGSRYWYCIYPDHIAFINPTWSAIAAKTLSMSVESLVLFSHAERGPVRRLFELSKNIAYKYSPSLSSWLRKKGFGNADVGANKFLLNQPPSWMTAKDHLLLRLKND